MIPRYENVQQAIRLFHADGRSPQQITNLLKQTISADEDTGTMVVWDDVLGEMAVLIENLVNITIEDEKTR